MEIRKILEKLKEGKKFIRIRTDQDYVGNIAEIKENHVILKPADKPVLVGLFGTQHQPPPSGLKIPIGEIRKVSEIIDDTLIDVA